jgi:hypothetical protein
MTCTARMPSPCVLHKAPLVLVRKDDPVWHGMQKLPPAFRWSTRDLITIAACCGGIGFLVGFITLALLISYLGPHS